MKTINITREKVLTRKLVPGFYYVFNTDIPLSPGCGTYIGGYRSRNELVSHLKRKYGHNVEIVCVKHE